jgi:Xaa-Pro aminopeptidase
MPSLNAEGARAETDIGFHAWTDADGPQTALRAALAEVGAGGVRKLAIDETMRADFALLAMDAVPNSTLSYASDTVGALRLRKDATEYALLKMNALIADRAMLKAFAAIRPGMTEVELAGVVKAHFGAEGASAEFWIVGAGGNGAYPHHSASERKLATGDAVVIDIGGRKGGYPSDITRMAAVGHAPEGYPEVHAVVEAAVMAALAAARPGVRAREVDAAARDVITKAGYGPYFVHRTGHGLGIDGHEPPYLTATSDTVLEEGMVFSIEPGIYLPGRFGIRLEEIVILRADGPEILSELPRAAMIIA